MANPRPRVLAHLKVFFVQGLQANVAELSIAFIDRLLGEVQVALEIDAKPV